MSRKTSSSAPELRVAGGELDGVADVAEVLEAYALHDAAAGDVEAGDHALLDHASALRSICAPAGPLRSGWNWTPATTPCLDRGDHRAVVIDVPHGDAVDRRDMPRRNGRSRRPPRRDRPGASIRLAKRERVPAHVRDCPARATADGPGEKTEARASFLAGLEEQLHADADAERRRPRRAALAERLVDAGAREPAAALATCPTPATTASGARAPRPIGRDDRLATGPRERGAEAAQVPGTVVRDRNPHVRPGCCGRKVPEKSQSWHGFVRLSTVRSPRVAGGFPSPPRVGRRVGSAPRGMAGAVTGRLSSNRGPSRRGSTRRATRGPEP